MKKIQQFKSRFAFALLHLFPFIASAQNPQDVEMADSFRSDGKIYVVIAIMSIILIGLFIYLFMIGQKVSALEKKMMEKK